MFLDETILVILDYQLGDASISLSWTVMQDPIIESIRKAEDRLTNSASFLRFLGQQAMNEKDYEPEEEEQREEKNYHFISLLLNLVNTYFYMVSVSVLNEGNAHVIQWPVVCDSFFRITDRNIHPSKGSFHLF